MGHPLPERIELAKSGLCVEDGELVKKDSAGKTVIARHRLGGIRKLDLRKGVDPVTLWFIGGFAGGSYLFWRLVPATWGKVTAGVLMVLACLCVLGIRKFTLRVEDNDGHVEYDLVEDRAECEGFLHTLKGDVRRVQDGL